MLELNSAQRLELRARAHTLHPVVSIAENGLSASVLKEIDQSLTAHELIKIRVYGDDREQRAAIYAALCEKLTCAPIQQIGKLLVVFRPRPTPEVVKTKSAPTTRRPSGRDGAVKKTLSNKLGARTAGVLKRSIAKAKRAEPVSPSRGPAKPRAVTATPHEATGIPGRRRTNGTTIKPTTGSSTARSGNTRPSARPTTSRGPKR